MKFATETKDERCLKKRCIVKKADDDDFHRNHHHLRQTGLYCSSYSTEKFTFGLCRSVTTKLQFSWRRLSINAASQKIILRQAKGDYIDSRIAMSLGN